MTERFTIEDCGNMFRVLDDSEILTTKFENWDRDDIKNLVELLNELHRENQALILHSQQQYEIMRNAQKENKQLRGILEEGLEVSQVEIDEELERMNKNE